MFLGYISRKHIECFVKKCMANEANVIYLIKSTEGILIITFHNFKSNVYTKTMLTAFRFTLPKLNLKTLKGQRFGSFRDLSQGQYQLID